MTCSRRTSRSLVEFSVSRVDGQQIGVVPGFQSGISQPGRGKPTWATTSRDGASVQVRLSPIPDAAYTVDVEVSTLPTRAAQSFEDDLVNYWSDALVAGAFSRLYAVPGQAFSNPVEAIGQAQVFSYLTRKARAEGDRGRTRASLTVRPRPLC